jgi:hypothetical protein
MYFYLVVVIVTVSLSISHSVLTHTNNDRIHHIPNPDAASITSLGSEDSSEADPHHPRHGTVGNYYVVREYDCALRAFTIEMATYIKPNSSISNWTALSESALQMQECNMSYRSYEPSADTKPFKTAPEMKKRACLRTVFVHGVNGDDSFDGTFDSPMQTIQAALSLTRVLCTVHGNNNALCIAIRGALTI